MLGMFKQLVERWTKWLGDGDLEKLLRAHLVARGYLGETAQFQYLRLVAIQRPGWVQVYTFLVEAKESKEYEPQRLRLHGIVRQDERYSKTEIQLFAKQYERNALFEEWSEGLVKIRRPNL